ncbi:MAG: DUF4870 domain-containing protein [Anaerolineae bacterium]
MTDEMDTKDNEELEGKDDAQGAEQDAGGGGMSMDEITSDDKLWALLAYVFTPLVPIIILLMEDKKNRPFIRAHNAQALAWGLINVVGGTILSTVLFFCFGLPSILIWLAGVYWGWQAYQGQMVTIPVVTNFVKQQGWA